MLTYAKIFQGTLHNVSASYRSFATRVSQIKIWHF